MKKYINAFLLCMTLVFLMSTSAQAEGTTVTIDGREWTYVVTDESAKTAEIIGFLPCGYNTAVMPSSVNGYTVTSFKGSDDVFKRKRTLVSVEIPGTVKVIPSAAFKEDSSLSTVILHEGLETIDISAFSYSGISSINLPQGVKTISSYAFGNCSYLTSITIPASVTTIAGGAFDNCVFANLTIHAKAYDNDNRETAAFTTAKSIRCKFEDPDLGAYALITYELNGGTQNNENPVNYFTNKSESWTLKAPTRDGYIFKCWADDDGNQITSLTNTVANNSSVNAIWEKPQYRVEFIGNGATSGSMATMNIEIGESKNLSPNAFTKKGYSFAGWNTQADGSGNTFLDKAEVYNLSSTHGTTVTLYAKWSLATYAITYELNGGTNDASNPASYTIESDTITLKNATRAGYNFLGWYRGDSKVTNIAGGSFGNVTLTAKWAPITYAITYELNGGTNDASNPASYTIESDTITLKNATRAGYNFLGWYNADAIVTQIVKGSTGDITLTAKWEEISEPKVTIGFEKAKLYINKGDKVSSKFNNPDNLKVTFSSSNKNVVAVDSKGKLTAKKVGKAVITAKASGKTYKCTVSVYDPKIDGKSTVTKGKSITLKVKNGYGKTIWKSSNTKIATISSSGKVTGKKKGTVTITAINNGRAIKKKIVVK